MSSRPDRKNLRDFTLEELKGIVKGLGQTPYRAGQLYRWLFQKGARSVDEMTDISKEFRSALKEAGYHVGTLDVARTQTSADGTVKLLLALADGVKVESVLIPGEKRLTLCVSTQAGCALGCRFCLTGMAGAGRNLKPSELIGQVLAASLLVKNGFVKEHTRITNVVLMGMGEPLLNYDNVVRFLGVLTDPEGMGFSSSRVTVSTAGIVPGIKGLGRDTKVNLAVSLNATTDEVRTLIMPVNKKYPIKTLLGSLRAYPLPPRRLITIEYVLIKGVNDSTGDAERLVKLLKGVPCKINLIPLNPFSGSEFKRPETSAIGAFQKILFNAGYTALLRESKGNDILAACGQLRGEKSS
ncbi:MAG: 23S rRNA (adenine(2503)-C(2))-methyltransferase RlmN [Deltaproteobacteria bacterium]|nr:23S rRNA (adenine(2503)-C(2))-methyltransferase RlmN [Deltaproteobacteria bacterium]